MELRQRFGIALSIAESDSAIAAEIAYYRVHHDDGRDRPTLAALRRTCAEVLRAALPAPAAATLERLDPEATELTEALLASLRFAAFPNVTPALTALRARGIRLVVASNWDCSLSDVLARLELMSLLDGVVTSAEVGARKPAAALFERALALAAVPRERALHVGDSVEADIAGAREAGLEAVLIRRDRSPGPEGVRTITALTELMP